MATLRMSPNEEEACRVQRLRASATQRVVQAREAAKLRGRAQSRAARAKGRAEEGARDVWMLEEGQNARRAALEEVQAALEKLREDMGEAQTCGAVQRVVTARSREEDAIRASVRESRAALRFKLAELTVLEDRYALGAKTRAAERRRDKSALQRAEDRKSARQYREECGGDGDARSRRGAPDGRAAAAEARGGGGWPVPRRPRRVEDYLHTRMHVQRPLCFRYTDVGDEPATSLAEAAMANTERARANGEARLAVLEARVQERFEAALGKERLLISQHEMETTLEKCARYERVAKSRMYANDIARLARDMRAANASDDPTLVHNPSLNVDAARRTNVDAAFEKVFGAERARAAVPVRIESDTREVRAESGDEAVRVPTSFGGESVTSSMLRAARYATGVVDDDDDDAADGDDGLEQSQKLRDDAAKHKDAAVRMSLPGDMAPDARGTLPSPYPQPRKPFVFPQHQSTLPRQLQDARLEGEEEERHDRRNEDMRVSNSSIASSTLSSMLSKMSLDALGPRVEGLNRQSSELDSFDVDDMTDSILGAALEDPLKELTALDSILHDLSTEVKESHQNLVEMSLLPESGATTSTAATTTTTTIAAAREDISISSSSSDDDDGDDNDFLM